MAAATSYHPLTEENLAVHDRQLQSNGTKPVTWWAERVIIEERTHQFCSQLGATIVCLQPGDINIELDMDHLDQQISSTATTPTDSQGTLDSLKLCEQRPYTCLESPLERFLTPGTSEVSCFYLPALAHMGIQFGSMEGSKKRSRMARANIDLVRNRALGACEIEGIAF